MLKTVIETAGNVSIYPQVALILFVMVFASVLIREWLRPRKEVDHLASMPLSDGDDQRTR